MSKNRFIVTSSDSALAQASHMQSILAQLVLAVPAASKILSALVAAVSALEIAFVRVQKTAEVYRAAVEAEKKVGKSLRECVFGVVAYIEILLPELVPHLPIFSKFDLNNAYVVADEMCQLAQTVPELAHYGQGLKRAKDEHVRLVSNIAAAERERTAAAEAYRSAQLELTRLIAETRKYIFDNRPEGSNFAEQLKRQMKKPKKRAAPAQLQQAAAANDEQPSAANADASQAAA